MIKKRLRLIVFFLTTISFFNVKSYSQLIITHIEEPSINTKSAQKTSNSDLRIQTVNAVTTYSDTLLLPFFEDFSGVVVPIDSIVISTSDSLVKVYSKVLNSYADGTAIFIGFNTIPAALTIADSLNGQQWFIKKNAVNEFLIDSSATLTNPKMFYATDTTYTNAYWRQVTNNYSATLADSLKWQAGSNTYVNNRFPLNPMSYNVATFDGMQANGVPYSTAPLLTGYADVLTSLPINLTSLTSADSVYLTFYYQQTGLGEAPDPGDFFELDFLDSTGVWNMVDTINGLGIEMDTFLRRLIVIDSSTYFHKNFQFRFRSHGNLSGPFDVWHLDYIYLDKNRVSADSGAYDISVGNASVSFLKNYTSMPYNQYFANKANEIGQLRFTTNDNYRGHSSKEDFQTVCTLTTNVPSTSYNYFYKSLSAIHNMKNYNIGTYQDSCSFPSDSLKNQSFPMLVDVTYRIGFDDTSNIFYVCNNTYVTSTILWDYYAYDDGTPEAGIGLNQIGAKAANKFTITLSDTITDVDMYFTRGPSGDLTGDDIFICIWDNNFKLLSKNVVQVKYGGYIRYHLPSPVIVGATTFYVGYLQNFVDLLSVGYDRNYDHSDKIFFNLEGTTWNAYNQLAGYQQGSMMIRPVFSKHQILITPILDKEEQDLNVVLYPVPTDNELKIKGRVSEISLYDLAGKKLADKIFDPYEEEKSIDVSSVPNGLYITQIVIGNTTLVKKVLVQHGY
jgi:hypothetical protein